ncbi:cytochrome-c peroxidase [Asticcacaulis sp. AC460]|uniref:cytochrome-c peroxidase n=1 Tax=Asticcacaulis sp. AC460 TaxID=1282360 RepID=UPI0004228036|nr:cytochrome c peroxidase [Asticcacaulis sp. AC460]
MKLPTNLRNIALVAATVLVGTCIFGGVAYSQKQQKANATDVALTQILTKLGVTGTLQTDYVKARGKPIDPQLAELGQFLFFDTILSLANDNSCSGCHAPQAAFSDTQSIAIGVGSNCVVGPSREGLHNQRRSPSAANAAVYPSLMWNGRFSAVSGNPFDNSQGYLFPAPEGDQKFAPYDSNVKSLMAAQGHMPSTELVEMAGTGGTEGLIFAMSKFGGEFGLVQNGTIRRAENTDNAEQKANNLNVIQFHKNLLSAPLPNKCGLIAEQVPEARPPLTSPNEPIRLAVLKRLQNDANYVRLFQRSFPSVAAGEPINFSMVGTALAEFQLKIVMADAPIDRYARGDLSALTPDEKAGALIFFGKGNCISCHAVSGNAKELYSDFAMHNIGVPPLYPKLSQPQDPGEGNVEFKGPNKDEDLGFAEFIGEQDVSNYYMFRTSPLRNVGLQPTFMHNGAYTRLSDAIDHHFDPVNALMKYDPGIAGVRSDLFRVAKNRSAIAATIDPLLRSPPVLTKAENRQLLAFVSNGLTDPRARPQEACKLVPTVLPSGRKLHTFEGC